MAFRTNYAGAPLNVSVKNFQTQSTFDKLKVINELSRLILYGYMMDNKCGIFSVHKKLSYNCEGPRNVHVIVKFSYVVTEYV